MHTDRQLEALWRKYNAATDAYLACTDARKLPALEAAYVAARNAYDGACALAAESTD